MASADLYLAVATIGGVVLLVGVFSSAIRRSPVSEPMLALGLGILLGPAVTGLLDPHGWADVQVMLREVARLTLAIGLMGVALRLPRGYFRRHWRSLLMLLGPVMVLMWLVSGFLAWWALGVGIWLALLIGACLTPTDPILASAIVGGGYARRWLRHNLRHTISGESGANDGLGLLLVMLPVLMLTRSPAGAAVTWIGRTLLWEVALAVVLGIVMGVLAGRLLHWAERRHTITRTSLLSYSIALSLTVLGVTQLIGSDGILAVFVAGRAFTSVATVRERNEEERVQEAVNQFFTLPVFVLLGMTLPWGAWAAQGWAGVALAVGVLAVRRLPAMLMLRRRIATLRHRADAAFAGWFGPIGIAALLYATQASEHLGDDRVWVAVSLVVFASIVVHGITAAPAMWWYARQRM